MDRYDDPDEDVDAMTEIPEYDLEWICEKVDDEDYVGYMDEALDVQAIVMNSERRQIENILGRRGKGETWDDYMACVKAAVEELKG